MFHLFNKVYLDFDFNLQMGNYIVVSEAYRDVPIVTAALDETCISAASYNALLEEQFDNNEETLWGFLQAIPADKQFFIYASEQDYPIFVSRFLRALFPNITTPDMYIIYRLSILKCSMINSQMGYIDDHNSDVAHCYHCLEPITEQEFINRFDGMESNVSLELSTKYNVSTEFLLPSYLYGEPTEFDNVLKGRFIKFLWKLIVWDIEELKREILNGFFNLDQIYPELAEIGTLDFNTTTIEDVVERVPDLKFLTDRECGPHNIPHIQENYDVEKIYQIYYRYLEVIGRTESKLYPFPNHIAGPIRLPYKELDLRVNLSIDDFFAENEDAIRGLIEADIDTKFGSQIFARQQYREKMNPLIISYMYSLKQNDDQVTLARFKLT